MQEQVQKIVDDLVATGRQRGIQVAVYRNGEPFVDAVAGAADTSGRPVTADTPFFSFSTGKGLTATVVHVLAEHGLIDYHLPIADVWPEFARHGKERVTLRHALTHTAGVPQLPSDLTASDVADWDRMCAIVADSAPLWEPGTARGYHAWSFAWLVGETVRRATGRTLSDLLVEYVSGPLGLERELFLAVPETELDRLAYLEDGDWLAAAEAMGELMPNLERVSPPGVGTGAVLGNRRDILTAEIGAVGTMSARAVAKMYAALIAGDLISPERLAAVTAVAHDGIDWTFGLESRMGLGYVLEDGYFGYAGVGGSVAFALPDRQMSVAVTVNRLSAQPGVSIERIRTLIADTVGP